MSLAPKHLSVGEFSFRMLSRPGSGSIFAMIAPSDLIDRVADRLRSELEIQGDSAVVHIRTPTSATDLIGEIQRAQRGAVVLVSGVEEFRGEAWGYLDLSRSRLLRDGALVFVLSATAINELTQHAPNLASWVGGSVWTIDLSGEILSEEERLERLRSLRDWSNRSDDDILRLAADGSLPPEPEYVEWLVLLKRPDLIGNT